MQIDDYAEAIALSNKLEAAVPLRVRPGKEFLKVVKQQGKPIFSEDELKVTLVKYSGDMGGIMCTVAQNEGDAQVFMTSLTHLKLDPTHPLAEEVKAYQQKRIRRLKLQDQKSFLAEMGQLERSPKLRKKSDRGFGK